MRSSSGYASIWCIFFHQLQPRDSMAPITRGLPNGYTRAMDYFLSHNNPCFQHNTAITIFLGHTHVG